MLDSLLRIVAPHHCYECHKAGSILCSNCKYNIISEPYAGCIVCTRPVSTRNVCSSCHTDYDQAWCVGEREGTLKQLIDDFKFNRVYVAAGTLANLLDETIPDLPMDTIVTYIPTIAPHIRQRGYDHARLLAKMYAKRRGLPFRQLLERQTKTVQHGASRKDRIRQAAEAFGARKTLIDSPTILLIDDIVTTGESLDNGARLLKEAGAGTVYVGVVAKQPFKTRPKG